MVITLEWLIGIGGSACGGLIWLLNDRKNRRLEKIAAIEAETTRIEIRLKNEQHNRETHLKERSISLMEDGVATIKKDVEILSRFKENTVESLAQLKITMDVLNKTFEIMKDMWKKEHFAMFNDPNP